MDVAEFRRVQARGGKRGFGTRPTPRPEPGRMNTFEAAYARRLEVERGAGDLLSWSFEPVKFRLAKKTFYTPDFLVVTPTQVEFHEVKGGHVRDDARAKWKIAAELHPWARWVFVQTSSLRLPWQFEEYGVPSRSEKR